MSRPSSPLKGLVDSQRDHRIKQFFRQQPTKLIIPKPKGEVGRRKWKSEFKTQNLWIYSFMLFYSWRDLNQTFFFDTQNFKILGKILQEAPQPSHTVRGILLLQVLTEPHLRISPLARVLATATAPKPPLCCPKHGKGSPISSPSTEYSPWVNGGNISVPTKHHFAALLLPICNQDFSVFVSACQSLNCFYTNSSGEVEREGFTQDKLKTLKMTSDWCFLFTCLSCQSIRSRFPHSLLCCHTHQANWFPSHSAQEMSQTMF